MTLPPAVIIHGLPHALSVLAAARPVTLLSAPGAACYAGCGWWRAVVTAALAAHPGAVAPDVLDCADAPGRALEALSLRCGLIVLQPGPAWPDIAARAEACGARLLAAAPPALDMGRRGEDRRLAAWLAA
ncbi:MAG TPA: hypothetical protein VGC15_14780 [Acetobacteraceae bacterium]